MNLAQNISPNRPPTREGVTEQEPWPTANTPIFGSVTDQEPLWYEEPHPCTEPEAIRIIIIGVEKRFYHQRTRYTRASPQDTLNFIPWDRSAEVKYEILSFNKYEGNDDVITVDNLDDLLDGLPSDPRVNQEWLTQYLDIINGSAMTPGDPGYKGYTAAHKQKSHWDNYTKYRKGLHQKIDRGECTKTHEEVDADFAALCQFSVINDSFDKNFALRAYLTKTLRRQGVIIFWHSNAPQTWSSELRYCANGLNQINPEIFQRDEWDKFRSDFKLNAYKDQEEVLYMHLLDEVTMFHTTVRARNGEGATFNVSNQVYMPPNNTEEQKSFVDGMFRQVDLVCSDLEVIAIQNDPKLPLNSKLVYLEGDDHLKSQLAALGQVLPNYVEDRKKYNIFCQQETENTTLELRRTIQQLTRIQEDDRLHMAKLYLSTQVDCTRKQSSLQVRVPRMTERKERSTLVQKRRQRLSQYMANWQVDEQLAKVCYFMVIFHNQFIMFFYNF